jgi:hypothetical protein
MGISQNDENHNRVKSLSMTPLNERNMELTC